MYPISLRVAVLALLLSLLPFWQGRAAGPAAAQSSSGRSGEPPNGEPPNIVIILADDLGYGDISAFKGGWIETPHLDHLARQGMRLTDFHSGGPACSPTRASLVTGRYRERAGIPGVVHHGDPGLHQQEFTLAELVKKAGYATGLFGKWHLGHQEEHNPVHHGFDEFLGFVSGNVDYFSHVDNTGVFDWWKGTEKIDEEGYSTHLISKHAVDFVERHQGDPFFLYVAHAAPHWPYQGPNDEVLRKEGGKRTRAAPRRTGDVSYVRPRYRQMVREMDEGIGQLMETLKRLDRETLVFFLSDNGPRKPYGSAGALRGWKGGLFEGGHRIPAFAWWPSRIEAGSRSDETMITMDVLPTIAELIGEEPPDGLKLDGRSLLPTLLEGKALSRRQLFWAFRGQEAIRDGPWKLVRNVKSAGIDDETEEQLALYNLREDLAERNDLTEQYPERVERMVTMLEAWKKDVTHGATTHPK